MDPSASSNGDTTQNNALLTIALPLSSEVQVRCNIKINCKTLKGNERGREEEKSNYYRDFVKVAQALDNYRIIGLVNVSVAEEE